LEFFGAKRGALVVLVLLEHGVFGGFGDEGLKKSFLDGLSGLHLKIIIRSLNFHSCLIPISYINNVKGNDS